MLTTVFDVGWPDAPHRVIRNDTYASWDSAGRPPRGARSGEGEVVATGTDRRSCATATCSRRAAPWERSTQWRYTRERPSVTSTSARAPERSPRRSPELSRSPVGVGGSPPILLVLDISGAEPASRVDVVQRVFTMVSPTAATCERAKEALPEYRSARAGRACRSWPRPRAQSGSVALRPWSTASSRVSSRPRANASANALSPSASRPRAVACSIRARSSSSSA